MDLNLLLDLKKYISISGHTPGRLKLKLGIGAVRNPKVIEYVKVNGFAPPRGQKMNGIRKTSFNPITRSMLIEYDRDIIRPETLHKLFICEDSVEFDNLARQLASAADFDLENFLN